GAVSGLPTTNDARTAATIRRRSARLRRDTSAQRAPDDERDRNEDGRHEDRDGDVAALELLFEIDLRRQPVDHPVAHVHQNDAERGIDEVQRNDRELHAASNKRGKTVGTALTHEKRTRFAPCRFRRAVSIIPRRARRRCGGPTLHAYRRRSNSARAAASVRITASRSAP